MQQPPLPQPTPADSHSQQPVKKELGDFIMSKDAIPTGLHNYMKKVAESTGKPAPDLIPARQNGSYRGPVLMENNGYLVQSVGQDGNKAIVHKKDNLTLEGDYLNQRAAAGKLRGTNLQIHYKDDKAQVYPLAEKKLAPETIMDKAQKYAAENIRNAKQREAFLKHLENVTQHKQPEQPDKAQKAAEQGKKAEKAAHGIER